MRRLSLGPTALALSALTAGCLPAPAERPAPILWVIPPAPSAPPAAPDPAQGPTEGEVALDYTRSPGADDCMQEDEFRAAASLTRTDLFAPPGAGAPYRVQITLDRAGGERSYRAVVTLLDAAGAELGRTLNDGNRCSDVLARIIVNLYHMIGPRPAPRPVPVPVPRRPTPREMLAALCKDLEGVYGPCMDVRAAVLAGGLLSAGYPNDIAGGFYVGGEVFFGEHMKEPWSAGLEMRALMPAVAIRYPDGDPVEVSSITGALSGCYHYSVLGFCGFFEAGTSIQGGAGTARSGSDFNPLVALGPRLALHLPISGRFTFRAFADMRILAYSTGVNIYDSPMGPKLGTWDPSYVNGLLGVGFSY